MRDMILQSGWENVLLVIPFVGILLVNVFRLDEIIASPKRSTTARRPLSGCDENGDPLLCDPDGRPSSTPRKAR